MELYNKSIDEAISEFDTDKENGLSSDDARERLSKYGTNELKEESKKSFLSKLKDQFSDFLVIILIVAAIVSFAIGEKADSVVIIAIVILNAFLGVYQEGRAEKALESLQKMTSPTAKVIRNGKKEIVESSTLVPGDIVVLEAGDIIPADLRLIETSNLKIEEASLTGESVPVEKHCEFTPEGNASLGDRHNMAYMGTTSTYGRGKGLVSATGHNTEIGKIATQIQTFDDEVTPLQKKLNGLGKSLGIIVIIVCIIVFAVGTFQGRDKMEMFMTAISLAVAAIPEGLPAIVTIVLALGMNRMVEKNAIVKKLLAVETLGSTTVICSDKTGTLTQNEMTVVNVFTDNKIYDVTGGGYEPVGDFLLDNEKVDIETFENNKNLDTLLDIAILTNDSSLENNNGLYSIIGDPTEGALVTLAGKANLEKDKMNESYPRVDELPFDSTRKMMTTIHSNYIEGKYISFTKGAPDIIINRCSHIILNEEVIPFTDELKQEVLNQNSTFAQRALRVLAFSYKEYADLPQVLESKEIEQDMVFVGLVGMIDPPREEAREAIKTCKKAGIQTVMITGDYKDTAFAIAKNLGLANEGDSALTGAELDKLSDQELREVVKTVKVYARVSPEHKVRIVSALKDNGHITAMTGDGVNDAPALKKADIGVAMGITGTDVAKNTAEMILTDDNFASIVSAVEEGRIIYDNIVKFVMFLLSCNIGEILIVFTSILMGLPVPLIAIQLLWLNLVTDSFPALALGVEKGDPDIMDREPRDSKEPLLNKDAIVKIALQSISIAVSSMIAYIYGLNKYPGDLVTARAMVFATLITAELLRAYSSRSQRHTIFELGFTTNRTMLLGTGFSFVLLLLVVYVPFLQPIFDTVPLSLSQWGIILLLAIIPFAMSEIHKVIQYRNK